MLKESIPLEAHRGTNNAFYTDYVGHMLRCYTKHEYDDLRASGASRENWVACDWVIRKLNHIERGVIFSLFGVDAVGKPELAERLGVKESLIDRLLYYVLKEIAKKRGLL